MEEFKIIPLYPRYTINEQGVVKDTYTDKVLSESSYRQVRLCEETKSFLITVARLLAITFLKNDSCSDYSKLFVYCIDGNRNNLSLDNLLFLTRQQFEIIKFKKIKEEINSRYPLSAFHGTGYYPNPWEQPNYPGYYRIPFADNGVIINREGDLIFLKDGSRKKKHILRKGYWGTNLSINGTKTCFLVHRILAMLFLPVPVHLGNYELEDLHVNHKNGIKTDIDLNNLEWCTRQENRDHAIQTGLITLRPVLRRDCVSNDIVRYESISLCCKDNFLSKDMMYCHLYSKYAGLIKDNGYVYKFDNGVEWPHVYDIKDPSVNLWTKCDVVAKNIVTNEMLLFKSIRTACEYLNLNLKTLGNIRHRKGLNHPYDNWIFYPLDKENFKNNKKVST